MTTRRRLRVRARPGRAARSVPSCSSDRRSTTASRRCSTSRATCPTHARTNAVSAVAEEVAELCELSAGRALVLTSSYRTLAAVADRLRGRARRRAARPGRGAARAPARAVSRRGRLRARRDRDVLARASTCPGESLSLLVIDKLPFQPPDDPLVEARCERIAAEGGDWFCGVRAARRPSSSSGRGSGG